MTLNADMTRLRDLMRAPLPDEALVRAVAEVLKAVGPQGGAVALDYVSDHMARWPDHRRVQLRHLVPALRLHGRGPTRLGVRAAGQSHPGAIRERNEDDYQLIVEHQLFMIADGMGGHCSGWLASKVALWGAIERYQRGDEPGWAEGRADPTRDRLIEAMTQANERVRRIALPGIGSTVAALCLSEGRALIAHAGDCRVYRLGAAGLEALTRDHTLLTAWDDPSRPLPAHYHGIVTSAMGCSEIVEVEIGEFAFGAGDRFLLCTDGVHKVLQEEALAALLEAHGGDPEGACEAIVAAAMAREPADNLSACVVEVVEAQSESLGSGRSAPPEVGWLYCVAGPLEEVPQRWREVEQGAGAIAWFNDLHQLIMGQDVDIGG